MGWDLGKRFNLFVRIPMPTIKPYYHNKKKFDLIELYIEVIISYENDVFILQKIKKGISYKFL